MIVNNFFQRVANLKPSCRSCKPNVWIMLNVVALRPLLCISSLYEPTELRRYWGDMKD